MTGLSLNLQPAQSRAFVTPATECLYGGSAGGGKALALDTPIPTPTGWKLMGNLQPGDKLLDDEGRPCRVLAVSETWTDRECYRLTFDDGATIDASAEHLWRTFDASELAALTRKSDEWRAARRAKRPSRSTGKRSAAFVAAITARNKAAHPAKKAPPQGTVRTTAELAKTLLTTAGRTNHAIPLPPALALPEATLPVDAYCLGYWLGDGTRGQGAITQAPEDMEQVLKHFEAAGFHVRKRPSRRTAWGILGLQKTLRLAGLMHTRAIPPTYLRASEAQRLAMLQGLMDSDGSADKNGNLEFTTTNAEAAESFGELLSSLGIKGHCSPGRAMLSGRDCGPKWRFRFTTAIPVFRLPRKLARQANAKHRRTTRIRYLLRCERIPSIPVRCIQVDSPSSMFLAGRHMVPTHNSHLLRVAAIAWCQMIPGLQVALFRRTFPDLNANHMEGPTSFPALLAPLMATGAVRIVQGEILWSNGSRISLCHCQHDKDRFKYQGQEFHVLLIDELTHFSETIYNFLRARVRMTGLNVPRHLRTLFPRILCSSNPGGVGHTWVKRTFVDKGTTPQQMPDTEGGMVRQYLPARLSDNPALLQADPTYIARLQGLGDPLLVRAMLDGDWNIVAGAMFGDVWRNERHTCKPFAIPLDWPIWWGADDGFIAPASVHFLTRDPNTKTIFTIGEIYRPRMLPREMAGRIERMSRNIMLWHGARKIEPSGELYAGIMDNAAFAETGQDDDRGQQAISRGQQLRNLGLRIDLAEKWPGSRIHRARELHRLLAPNPNDPRGLPGIRFFENCTKAIETIPALPRDEKNPEDVDTDAEDHAYDSVTYALQRAERRFRTAKVA